MYKNFNNFNHFCLVPPLLLGALSVHLVRLWVNPALKSDKRFN